MPETKTPGHGNGRVFCFGDVIRIAGLLGQQDGVDDVDHTV
jgi:hypothetical protein